MTVEEMLAATEDPNVAYTKFMLKFKRGSDTIYCCFEGQDDKKYYSIRIKNITKKNDYEAITCNGKGNVIQLYNKISGFEEYKDAKIAYFIDRDFDQPNTNQDIYETPCYSVENFFTNRNVFETILTHEFEMSKEDNEYQICMDLFTSTQIDFHKQIHLLNSWLACQRAAFVESGDTKRLNIDKSLKNYLKDKLVTPKFECIVHPDLQTLDKIISIFPESHSIPNEKLEIKKSELFQNPLDLFRGKFELRFLIDFLHRLQIEIGNKKSSLFNKSYSCNVRFELDTAITTLSQYGSTPDCLSSYIESRLLRNVA